MSWQRARGLSSLVEEHRDLSEHQRYMAEAIFEAIARTGIFEMMVPRATWWAASGSGCAAEHDRGDFAARWICRLERHDLVG
jgi:hypothetical protein